jgi:Mysoin-binding motif of peroxisomes
VAFGLVWAIHWVRGSRTIGGASGRVAIVLIVVVVLATLGYAYVRRQWLQYLRQQTLTETRDFISKAHGLDAATSAAVTLIQEVELVSRGYRL